MKGLVLSGAALTLLMIGSAVALRFYRGNKEFRLFIGAFTAAEALYVAGFWLLPPDLGFLPTAWQETAPLVDFGNGFLLLVLMFHGYWCFCVLCLPEPVHGRDGGAAAPRPRGHDPVRGSRHPGERSAGQPHLPAAAPQAPAGRLRAGGGGRVPDPGRRASGSRRSGPFSSG